MIASVMKKRTQIRALLLCEILNYLLLKQENNTFLKKRYISALLMKSINYHDT